MRWWEFGESSQNISSSNFSVWDLGPKFCLGLLENSLFHGLDTMLRIPQYSKR